MQDSKSLAKLCKTELFRIALYAENHQVKRSIATEPLLNLVYKTLDECGFNHTVDKETGDFTIHVTSEMTLVGHWIGWRYDMAVRTIVDKTDIETRVDGVILTPENLHTQTNMLQRLVNDLTEVSNRYIDIEQTKDSFPEEEILQYLKKNRLSKSIISSSEVENSTELLLKVPILMSVYVVVPLIKGQSWRDACDKVISFVQSLPFNVRDKCWKEIEIYKDGDENINNGRKPKVRWKEENLIMRYSPEFKSRRVLYKNGIGEIGPLIIQNLNFMGFSYEIVNDTMLRVYLTEEISILREGKKCCTTIKNRGVSKKITIQVKDFITLLKLIAMSTEKEPYEYPSEYNINYDEFMRLLITAIERLLPEGSEVRRDRFPYAISMRPDKNFSMWSSVQSSISINCIWNLLKYREDLKNILFPKEEDCPYTISKHKDFRPSDTYFLTLNNLGGNRRT